jgi:hypothetical protein
VTVRCREVVRSWTWASQGESHRKESANCSKSLRCDSRVQYHTNSCVDQQMCLRKMKLHLIFKIPVAEDGNFVLHEGRAIGRCLVDKYANDSTVQLEPSARNVLSSSNGCH